jgi:hypothetical protein
MSEYSDQDREQILAESRQTIQRVNKSMALHERSPDEIDAANNRRLTKMQDQITALQAELQRLRNDLLVSLKSVGEFGEAVTIKIEKLEQNRGRKSKRPT